MTPAKKHTRLFYAHIAVIVFGLAAFAAGAFHGEIWFDEAYTVGAVRNNFSDMYAHITRDVHPPLYYILLWLWAQVFGSGFASLRIFSVLFAAALPLLGFTHIRRDFGERVGFLFSLFTAFSFTVFKYALQIRMYSMAAFLVALTAIYAYRFFKNGSTRSAAAFVLFSLLASYTHYFAFITAGMINLALLAAFIRAKNRSSIKRMVAAAFSQLVLYAYGIYLLVTQALYGGAGWITFKPVKDLFDNLAYPFYGQAIAEDKRVILYPVVIIFYIALIFLTVRAARRNKCYAPVWALGIFFAILAAGTLVSVFRPIMYMRYTVCFAPLIYFALAYAAAYGLGCAWRSVIAVLLALQAVLHAADYSATLLYGKETVTDIVDELSGQVLPGDTVVFDNIRCLWFAVNFPETHGLFLNTNFDPIVGLSDIHIAPGFVTTEDTEAFRWMHGRVWIINSHWEHPEHGWVSRLVTDGRDYEVLYEREFSVPYDTWSFLATLVYLD